MEIAQRDEAEEQKTYELVREAECKLAQIIVQSRVPFVRTPATKSNTWVRCSDSRDFIREARNLISHSLCRASLILRHPRLKRSHQSCLLGEIKRWCLYMSSFLQSSRLKKARKGPRNAFSLNIGESA